jgi:hypothetical protein
MSASERATIRLQLQGARQVIAELNATAGAVGRLTVSVEGEAVATERAAKASLLFNRGLSTLRQFAFLGASAIGLTAAEVFRLGFGFQTAMQQARVALAPVFDSTQALNDELSSLFRFTAYTPFQFKDITVAFRQMYGAFHPLGISIETTNQTLHSIADALSFVGRTSPDALNRVAVALQHMAFLGRLTGQSVLQLARDGLPIYAALTKELNLTSEQVHKIGAAGISSAVALAALNRYIETTPGYMNAAMRQATQSLAGAFTTFKDLLSQAIGRGQSGIFGFLQNTLQRVDLLLAPYFSNKKPLTLYTIAEAFDKVLTPKSNAIARAFGLVNSYVSSLARIVRTALLPALGDALRIVGPVLYPALLALVGVLAFLSHHTTLLRIVLAYLITQFILARVATLAWSVASRVAALNLGELVAKTNTARVATQLYELWVLRAEYAQLVAARATRIWAAAQLLLTRALRLAAIGMAAFDLALFANPIGLIIAGVAALIAVFALLYWKVAWFRNGVNAAFDWIKRHWPLLLTIIAGPIGLAVVAIVRNFDKVKAAALAVWNFIRGLFSKIGSAFRSVWSHIPGHGVVSFAIHHLPGLAAGGALTTAGSVLVGERGPEILTLPAGASVRPLPAGSAALPPFTVEITDNRPIELAVDGQKLAVAVSRHRTVLAEAVSRARLDKSGRA